MADFEKFIHWPERPSYVRIILSKVETLEGLDLQKNIVSSANNKWLICGEPRETLIPGSEPSRSALSHMDEKTSVQSIKR